MLSGVERDRALQRPHRRTQHRLADVLGILPGQYRMPPRGGVVAHVERQAGQEVRQLTTKQGEVRAILEALPSVEESLHLVPVVADLREEFGVRDAQACQDESFDVLVKLLKRHRVDRGSLPVGGHGRIGGIAYGVPAAESANSPHDRDGLDSRPPVRALHLPASCPRSDHLQRSRRRRGPACGVGVWNKSCRR
jgi:hypothetical protein